MPEIAEVEIVRRGLDSLVGAQLSSLRSHSPKISLDDSLVGEKVTQTIRRGKLIGISFGEHTLECHLRMTGRLTLLGASDPEPRDLPNRHLRAEAEFSDGRRLLFHDPRGFGTMRVAPTKDFGAKLGPDLFSSDLPDSPPASRRAIKAVILDQSVVAGIGNYLADESLWAAKVNPRAAALALPAQSWQEILRAAEELARRVLEVGGVSVRDYRDAEGRAGSGAALLRVYGRGGQPCERCGAELTKTVVGGRGTVFCPTCQPE